MKINEFTKIEECQDFNNLELEQGVIYECKKYSSVAFLCPCGCGASVCIYYGKGGWTMTRKEDKITLSPSILTECGAHYFIRDNKGVWA